jgi:hypothetical protein
MESGPRRSVAVALAAVVALAVAGCGGAGGPKDPDDGGDDLTATPAAQVTEAPSHDARVIGITITGSTVSPSGDRITVKRDQPVVLEIDAAAAGELHVHSSPEQHVEFPEGKSQVTLRLDQPGVVDVEDHTLDKLIVQLEVH